MRAWMMCKIRFIQGTCIRGIKDEIGTFWNVINSRRVELMRKSDIKELYCSFKEIKKGKEGAGYTEWVEDVK